MVELSQKPSHYPRIAMSKRDKRQSLLKELRSLIGQRKSQGAIRSLFGEGSSQCKKVRRTSSRFCLQRTYRPFPFVKVPGRTPASLVFSQSIVYSCSSSSGDEQPAYASLRTLLSASETRDRWLPENVGRCPLNALWRKRKPPPRLLITARFLSSGL